MIKKWLRKWLGVDSLEHEIGAINELILHEEAMHNGFRMLKPHLMTEKERQSMRWKGKPLTD